jgi:hypothetical protein
MFAKIGEFRVFPPTSARKWNGANLARAPRRQGRTNKRNATTCGKRRFPTTPVHFDRWSDVAVGLVQSTITVIGCLLHHQVWTPRFPVRPPKGVLGASFMIISFRQNHIEI